MSYASNHITMPKWFIYVRHECCKFLFEILNIYNRYELLLHIKHKMSRISKSPVSKNHKIALERFT